MRGEGVALAWSRYGMMTLANPRRGIVCRAARFFDGDVPLISRMEARDPSVTLDLHIRALLLLGVTRKDLAAIIGGGGQSLKRKTL